MSGTVVIFLQLSPNKKQAKSKNDNNMDKNYLNNMHPRLITVSSVRLYLRNFITLNIFHQIILYTYVCKIFPLIKTSGDGKMV